MKKKETPITRKAQRGESCVSRHNKDSRNLIKRQISALLYRGEKYSAVQLNEITGGSDARKRISELRAQGLDIKDTWVGSPRYKLYWWERMKGPNLPGKEAVGE